MRDRIIFCILRGIICSMRNLINIYIIDGVLMLFLILYPQIFFMYILQFEVQYLLCYFCFDFFILLITYSCNILFVEYSPIIFHIVTSFILSNFEWVFLMIIAIVLYNNVYCPYMSKKVHNYVILYIIDVFKATIWEKR